MDYPGSAAFAGGSPVNWCDVWALAALPTWPTTADGLRALRTAHPPAPIAWPGGEPGGAGGGLAAISGTVTFVHPPGVGPQTIVGLAFVSPSDPSALVLVTGLEKPLTTERPGDVRRIALVFLSLSPPSPPPG